MATMHRLYLAKGRCNTWRLRMGGITHTKSFGGVRSSRRLATQVRRIRPLNGKGRSRLFVRGQPKLSGHNRVFLISPFKAAGLLGSSLGFNQVVLYDPRVTSLDAMLASCATSFASHPDRAESRFTSDTCDHSYSTTCECMRERTMQAAALASRTRCHDVATSRQANKQTRNLQISTAATTNKCKHVLTQCIMIEQLQSSRTTAFDLRHFSVWRDQYCNEIRGT